MGVINIKGRLNLCLLVAVVFNLAVGCASTQMPSLQEQCLDPNYKLRGSGRTNLMFYSSEGRTNMVRYLVKDHRGDVNAEDDGGYTALTYASLMGHTYTVKALLELCADVNTKDNCGRTPLMHAIANGHPDTVKALLEQGADVNAKDIYGVTVLMYASVMGHPDTVKALLEQGADVNAKTIMVAQKMGHPEIVRMLRKAEGLSKKEMPIEPAETLTIRTHESEFGFSIELSSRWMILSGHELEENPDLVEREFEHAKKTLKEADKYLIEQVKMQSPLGGVEVYWHQDYPGAHIIAIREVGGISQTNAELDVVCKKLLDFFSKKLGKPAKVYKSELKKIGCLAAEYIVLDFPDEECKRIFYHIQKAPHIMITFGSSCENQYFEIIKKKLDEIVKYFKVK
jgi:hypothetical protein